MLLNSRLSTKRKDALGNKKQVAGSGWQFLPPSDTDEKIPFFNGKYHREYMVPGKVSIDFINTFDRLGVNYTILLLTSILVQSTNGHKGRPIGNKQSGDMNSIVNTWGLNKLFF